MFEFGFYIPENPIGFGFTKHYNFTMGIVDSFFFIILSLSLLSLEIYMLRKKSINNIWSSLFFLGAYIYHLFLDSYFGWFLD